MRESACVAATAPYSTATRHTPPPRRQFLPPHVRSRPSAARVCRRTSFIYLAPTLNEMVSRIRSKERRTRRVSRYCYRVTKKRLCRRGKEGRVRGFTPKLLCGPEGPSVFGPGVSLLGKEVQTFGSQEALSSRRTREALFLPFSPSRISRCRSRNIRGVWYDKEDRVTATRRAAAATAAACRLLAVICFTRNWLAKCNGNRSRNRWGETRRWRDSAAVGRV